MSITLAPVATTRRDLLPVVWPRNIPRRPLASEQGALCAAVMMALGIITGAVLALAGVAVLAKAAAA